MATTFDLDDVILNFDPAAPLQRFRAAKLEAALAPLEAMLPRSVPWPSDAQPVPQPLTSAPSESDDLSRFRGYDALVVTWTAAEASALASLMSPGFPLAEWYEYRHRIQRYIPLVTGRRAPFNDTAADMARYHHSLGLYFPCRIGEARVLLFKSGLHLDYDGPGIPVRRLIRELVTTIEPKLLITTGTGGGIGRQVKLGDVVIAGTVRFDCRTQFKDQPFATATYRPTRVTSAVLKAISPQLTGVNAARIPGARPQPQVFAAADDAVVTTDFFAFDDSTNHFKLKGLGRACDMGDAMVANALQEFPDVKWYSIRNASDPQIPNPNNDIEEARRQAGEIYSKYGGLTTAASVIASWAIIRESASSARRGGRTPQVRSGARGDSASRPSYKLGRLHRSYDPRIPHLSALLAGQATAPAPAAVDYTKRMPAKLGMMLNDRLGDCTCAAFYHALQVWSFNATPPIKTEPDSDVEELYIRACGYNPRVAGEGPGGNEQHLLTYLLREGAPFGKAGRARHRITAFVEVDPRNLDDVKRTIAECGVAYIGFNVPQYITPADAPPPSTWDVQSADAQIVGGHAVILAGYDADSAQVISWGQYYTMTWRFFAKYVDEVYAIADEFWFSKTGKTPGGFTLAQLEEQMRALNEG